MSQKKKASGANIPEAQRGTVALKLRLSRETSDEIRRIAEATGLPLSEVVTGLVACRHALAITLRAQGVEASNRGALKDFFAILTA